MFNIFLLLISKLMVNRIIDIVILIIFLLIVHIIVKHLKYYKNDDQKIIELLGFKKPFKIPRSFTRIERFTQKRRRRNFKVPKPLTRVERFGNRPMIFKAPSPLTNVEKNSTSDNPNTQTYLKKIIDEYNKIVIDQKDFKINTIYELLKDIVNYEERGNSDTYVHSKNGDEKEYRLQDGNILLFPTFFDCRDKWPGCMIEPLFQGTCGSCWAFSIVTCLSSRFYIESCGNTGCNNYPQLNMKSLNLTLENISTMYNYRKIYLSDINKIIDKNNNKFIELDEWLDSIKDAYKNATKKENTYEKFYALQVLLYCLNFQSLGSIKISSEENKLDEVLERGKLTFKLWSENNDKIDIEQLENKWLSQPIPLSAEKLVSCCYPHCYSPSSSSYNQDNLEYIEKNAPQCLGGTLVDGWKLVRDEGVPSSLCIGYNLDSWEDGEKTPNCKELQGPNFNYCSGLSNYKEFWKSNFNKIIDESEKGDINPINQNQKNYNDLPWKTPQFFRFRAKNAYKVNNNMITIQREIIERGPVTTGFMIYEDFQYEFASKGYGGQYFQKGTNPLGSSSESLIYMWDGKSREIGGHAITIVGWGTYKDEDVVIPYWICLNSWGVEWGTNGYPSYDDRNGLPTNMDGGGYFWIVRGIDNCSIENNVVAGQPNMNNVSYPDMIQKYGWGLPYPYPDTVSLIPPFENNFLKTADTTIEYGKMKEGGGSFNELIAKQHWKIKSMKPPSPFTFFWPVERPLYCVGKLINNLENNINSRVLYVDQKTFDILNKIIELESNPLVLINNEQLQILKKIEYFENIPKIKTDEELNNLKQNTYSFIVNRGVNHSKLGFHKIGDEIKLFPNRNINKQFLDQFERCPLRYEE